PRRRGRGDRPPGGGRRLTANTVTTLPSWGPPLRRLRRPVHPCWPPFEHLDRRARANLDLLRRREPFADVIRNQPTITARPAVDAQQVDAAGVGVLPRQLDQAMADPLPPALR